MKIYTGAVSGPILDQIVKREIGIMISSRVKISIDKDYKKTNCALDNGAFACYSKGYPFQEDIFLRTLSKCYEKGIPLDFIVCPDIVCGGKMSLRFSTQWASGKLLGTPNLALVVQDGMKPEDLTGDILRYFQMIFIGGSVEWKWETAETWVAFAHKRDMKCHIGQCGQLKYLNMAKKIGADSVDSASFARHDSFHIVDEFRNPHPDLFENHKQNKEKEQ
jgi:hypothetical protein